MIKEEDDSARVAGAIIDSISQIIRNNKGKPVNITASKIMGVTWANYDVDMMDFYDDYPSLITVADLASDIELMDDDDDIRQRCWQELLLHFEVLQRKVAK